MPDLRFDPASLDKSAGGMTDAAEQLRRRTEALLGAVGDVTALGTNDTLGGVASMVYSVVLERVQETVDSVVDGLDGQSARLTHAARSYRSTEETHVADANTIVTEA